MVRDMAVVSAATTRNPDSLPSSQESTRAPFCGSGPQRQRSGGRKQGACQTGGAPRRRAGARRAPGIIGDIARRAARPFCQESTQPPFLGISTVVFMLPTNSLSPSESIPTRFLFSQVRNRDHARSYITRYSVTQDAFRAAGPPVIGLSALNSGLSTLSFRLSLVDRTANWAHR